MRALTTVLSCAAFLTVSAFAADTQVKQSAQTTAPKIVVASASMQRVQKAPDAAKTKTETPVRVWSLEMACCEAQ